MFDQVAGGSVEPLPEPVPGHSAEPAAAAEPENEESPFDALLGDLPQISLEPETVRDLSTSGEAETAVPSAPLDDQSPNSPFNFDLDLTAPENERTSVGSDLPTAAIGAAAARSGEAPGTPQLALDFEDEPVGQAPANWQGDYDYAELLVADDTPARGSQQYLRFDKREGSGKAHYHTTFPAVTGRVGIEFDLRCNDKNKFLLGFYVEKNGDFQQAIHTKILRSEAQSTPTIHMQGEAAPYLLGSWVHIKYIVDLDAGTLNGMIDSTHVVRDMPLQPNPGMLNTLSIRDNINTTGVLLIDNIRIYPIQ